MIHLCKWEDGLVTELAMKIYAEYIQLIFYLVGIEIFQLHLKFLEKISLK